eukprot:CAMPEP_0116898364 /NCGR_PEP_ID=MMETSP0467-20121206/7091_1 /TAXON_ID=283647 /ORGANISM="Mesodinium pulex, Strain SPMC105" /LENGTH=70 /DNA_ID=CAMNT_0004570427 /DNA_START=442 /DNA_END=654 /DNA_ORIENTATION=+
MTDYKVQLNRLAQMAPGSMDLAAYEEVLAQMDALHKPVDMVSNADILEFVNRMVINLDAAHNADILNLLD